MKMQSHFHGRPVVHLDKRILHFGKLNNRLPKCDSHEVNPNKRCQLMLGFGFASPPIYNRFAMVG